MLQSSINLSDDEDLADRKRERQREREREREREEEEEEEEEERGRERVGSEKMKKFTSQTTAKKACLQINKNRNRKKTKK